MEELISKIEDFITPRGNSEQHKFAVKQQTQIELIDAFGGDDMAGTWIDAYSRQFEEMINNPGLDLIHRLEKKETHAETLEEIKSKLYH